VLCACCATPSGCGAPDGSEGFALVGSVTLCGQAWESLRGDPLSWLLDAGRPNLHWKVLEELVLRPVSSPAVLRARGGANAAEPVASLLADLHPDGRWLDDGGFWRPYRGPGWRLVAAVQWGADPTDPRLHAAANELIESAPGDGGFAVRHEGKPVPWFTARVLQALAKLGWCRHPRFQEGLAWLEEGAASTAHGGWPIEGRRHTGNECVVTAVAVLGTLAVCSEHRRVALSSRAVESVLRSLGGLRRSLMRLGHPCLARTDLAEILWVLARSEVPLTARMVPALAILQRKQGEGGRWRREVPVPSSLPIGGRPRAGMPSRWVTLKCSVALMRYAVEAKLPRMYPAKPD